MLTRCPAMKRDAGGLCVTKCLGCDFSQSLNIREIQFRNGDAQDCILSQTDLAFLTGFHRVVFIV